ncbi:MAG: SufD family Fe-S cluster assembly protein [Nitrososphaerales archaeon]
MDSQVLSSLKEDYLKSTSADEPKWLVDIRERAFSYYQNLPSEVSPLYTKYSGVNVLKPESVYLSADHRELKEPFSGLEPRLDEIRNSGIAVIQVGSHLHPINLPDELKEKGVIIEGIGDALRNHEELVKPFLAGADPTEDKFLALECSVFNSGVFVYLPRNLDLEQPITIVHAPGDDGLSTVARNIFFADGSSRGRIVQELYSPKTGSDVQQVYFEFQESHVANNAELDVVTLQTMDGNAVHFSNRKAYLERDARINSYMGIFGTSLARYKVDNMLQGDGASAEHTDIVFGNGNQAFDITANMIHLSPNTRGRVMAKSVLKDTAKSLFKGMIKIGKHAKGSESYLAGHAILLDKRAKADAIPGLEIETNEVKATHSASVAQMDEEHLFYLMSRGMSASTAKRVIVEGFVEPLMRRMTPEARAWMSYLIDSKWQGKQLILKRDDVMREILEVEEARRVDTDIFEKHYKYR